MKKYCIYLGLVILTVAPAGCKNSRQTVIWTHVEKQAISTANIKNNALIVNTETGRPDWAKSYSEPNQIWAPLNKVHVEIGSTMNTTCVSFAGSYVFEHGYKSMQIESMTVHVLNEYDKQVWEQRFESAKHIYPEFEK